MLCLLVLFAFYKIFLESEKAHVFKRIFLLASIIISVVLPLITITYTSSEISPDQYFQANSGYINSTANTNRSGSDDYFFIEYLPQIIGLLYLVGVLIFSFRFFRNIQNIYRRIQRNEKKAFYSNVLVLLKSKLDPHTFLSYIFLNKEQYESDKISDKIILHEKAHADQKHSLDLILLEVIQIIFWINPFWIWFKKAVKLNHEFLADDYVVNKTRDPANYTDVLIKYAGGTHHVSLASSINYSLTKKRIVMISNKFSIKNLLGKLGLLLPILACCIYFFNNEIVAKPALASEENPVFRLYDGKIQNLVQEKKIRIKVEGDKLWVNGKATHPEKLLQAINKITNNWSKEDLINTNIEIKIVNSDDSFMENLNQEFSKTNLAKVSGRSFLPPEPPAPPSVKGEIVAVPPIPKVEEREIIEVPYNPSNEMHLSEKEEIIRAEQEELKQLHKELRQNENLSKEDRKRIQKEVEEKQVQIKREMKELEREHLKIQTRHLREEKKHLEMERRHMMEEREHLKSEEVHPEPPMPPSPPLPPSPKKEPKEKHVKLLTDNIKSENGKIVRATVFEEDIRSIYPEEATYYLNDKEISRDQALKLIKENKLKQVEISKTNEGNDVVNIYT